MNVGRSGASYWLRIGILGLATLATVLAISTDPADARRRKRHTRHGVSHSSSYSPPFASIVVDANSGKVMDQVNADSPRHPASLTKIMTLYLLFERLESGKIKLDSEMKVSEHASEQAPTKLGLRPGQTLKVEDAIKGLVTKSANDAAVVVAEAIGGSEQNFAAMMTRKARALGMTKTVYHNASGLPDDKQITTARDQALLGRAIQERYPRYYRYFSTEAFRYRGRVMRNHNHLLGNVDGVDGIKTGYTRASGFNLVTSVRRGNRHIVAVVLGGRSARSRDAKMRSLIAEHVAHASTRRTASVIAEARDPAETAKTVAMASIPMPSARPEDEPTSAVKTEAENSDAAGATPLPVAKPEPAPMTSGVIAPRVPAMPRSLSEPIKPVRVKTVEVRAKPARPANTGQLAPLTTEEPARSARTASAPSRLDAKKVATQKQARAVPSPQPNHGIGQGILGVLPADAFANTSAQTPMAPLPKRPPGPSPFPTIASITTEKVEIASATTKKPPARAQQPQIPRQGWIVQVGAFDNEGEARSRLQAAREKARHLLDSADSFTETVTKDDKTLYRARFAGLERTQAEKACKALKRGDIRCFTIKN